MSDTVVLRFRPANPGEYLAGIPARDLTAAELEANPDWKPRATFANPNGFVMYVASVKAGESDPRKMTRDDLNALAVAQGIHEPESFATKGDLLAAIEQAAAGGGQTDETTGGGEPGGEDGTA